MPSFSLAACLYMRVWRCVLGEQNNLSMHTVFVRFYKFVHVRSENNNVHRTIDCREDKQPEQTDRQTRSRPLNNLDATYLLK